MNTEAYKDAIDALKPGSAVIIFTPDSALYYILSLAGDIDAL